MKSRTQDGPHGKTHEFKGSKSFKKRNKMRLGGGGGLSLEAFANAKSTNSNHNPALIKKQREFYRNAKYAKKYKKTIKRHNEQQNHIVPATSAPLELYNETGDCGQSEGKKKNKTKKNGAPSLGDLYVKKREEDEKARVEREAVIRAKEEERHKAEARRKAAREKMFKKTRSGQPVMKYRIEHLLQSIQDSKAR